MSITSLSFRDTFLPKFCYAIEFLLIIKTILKKMFHLLFFVYIFFESLIRTQTAVKLQYMYSISRCIDHFCISAGLVIGVNFVWILVETIQLSSKL